MFVRTRGISRTFWLLGDQILYWRIAIGPWFEVPLSGGPSSVGGTTLGPVFCWTMWLIRKAVGPWTSNLPHAGGIGLSIIQSAADAFLLSAMWKRFGSCALALAVVLIVATEPYDMALTATIWNPPLAVAFVKTALAFVLLGGERPSAAIAAGATAAALLAAQAHSSAIFFAAPVIVSFALAALAAGDRHRAFRLAGASVLVVLVLEIPYLATVAARGVSATAPSTVVRDVERSIVHPSELRPAESFTAVTNGTGYILSRPWVLGWYGTLFTLCSLVTVWRYRTDVPLIASTIAPMAFAIAGFSFWQLGFDTYWFLVLAPGAAIVVALALTAWRPAAPWIAAALTVIAALAQPARLADALTIHRLPSYEAIVRGSREIRRRAPEVRSIRTAFDIPPTTDPEFVYEVLGGRIVESAPLAATIEPTGAITLERAGP